MDEVQFNEESSFVQHTQLEVKNPMFVQWLINWGLVKDRQTANILLIIIALTFFALSGYFFSRVFSTPNEDAPVEESSVLNEKGDDFLKN